MTAEVRARGAAGRPPSTPRGGRTAAGAGSTSVWMDAPAGGGGTGQIVEIQRARLLAAAVAAIDELGYVNARVGDITSRARVSRRTFYELFADRDECLAVVLEDVLGLIGMELRRAALDRLEWRERVRGGLWTVLTLFEREPVLARLCVVHALHAGPRVLVRREAVLADLTAVVDEGRRGNGRAGECTALTAEGLVGAAFAIVHARLQRHEREPLSGLLGELMAMIVLPYRGPAAARRELARAAPPRPAEAAPDREAGLTAAGIVGDPLDGVAMRLTYRTTRVLEGVAEEPGASNRQVAERAGISDQGQVSRLLARLERLGLLVNESDGHARGEPNAWLLTTKGKRIARSINAHALGRGIAA